MQHAVGVQALQTYRGQKIPIIGQYGRQKYFEGVLGMFLMFIDQNVIYHVVETNRYVDYHTEKVLVKPSVRMKSWQLLTSGSNNADWCSAETCSKILFKQGCISI